MDVLVTEEGRFLFAAFPHIDCTFDCVLKYSFEFKALVNLGKYFLPLNHFVPSEFLYSVSSLPQRYSLARYNISFFVVPQRHLVSET